jgi:isoleucyl-tRNA synthetase
MRNDGLLGAALEAKLVIHADAAVQARYAEMADELRFFFIVSELELAPLTPRPDAAVQVAIDGAEVWLSASVSSASKCVRCWHRRSDVGSHPEHPELCDRCISNIETSGEDRHWF